MDCTPESRAHMGDALAWSCCRCRRTAGGSAPPQNAWPICQQILKGKSLLNPLTIHIVLFHPPQTMKPDILLPELFKTGQITPRVVLDGGFATAARFYLFLSFLFISLNL